MFGVKIIVNWICILPLNDEHTINRKIKLSHSLKKRLHFSFDGFIRTKTQFILQFINIIFDMIFPILNSNQNISLDILFSKQIEVNDTGRQY